MPTRSIALSAALLLATAAGGLAVRFMPLGLPPVVIKYGGSMLWSLMVYWLVSALLSSWRMPAVALLTGLLTTAVELFKLYHSPDLDAFRLTIPGILLLGRTFSVWDISAYWFAMVLSVFVDQRLRGPASGGGRRRA